MCPANKGKVSNIKAEQFWCDPSMSQLQCLKVKKKVQIYWKDMDQVISKIQKIFLSNGNFCFNPYLLDFSLKKMTFSLRSQSLLLSSLLHKREKRICINKVDSNRTLLNYLDRLQNITVQGLVLNNEII